MTVNVCRRVFVDDVLVQGLVSVDNEVTKGWTGAEPDLRWTFVDAAGHFHAWDSAGALHTVELRLGHVDCDASCGGLCGGEGYSHGHWFCRLCQEEIRPGMIPGPHEVVLYQRQSWSVFVEDAPVIRAQRVSVRLEYDGKPTMFGVACVESRSGSAAGGGVSVKLSGEGPLSVMAKAPAGLVQT